MSRKPKRLQINSVCTCMEQVTRKGYGRAFGGMFIGKPVCAQRVATGTPGVLLGGELMHC